MSLTFISLFAGIGGLDLGLERAGMECVAQVEIDDYAQRVLTKHWPHVPKFRDVRSVGAHNLPRADLICGGFPCQDISSAGRGAGLAGARSGLWSEYARIVRELRPQYVLVENVAALLYRGLDRVLGDLAALGFDAEWHCIPAAAVGAPHIRDRIFIVAHARSTARRSTTVADAPVARDGRLAAGRLNQDAPHHFDGRGQALANADSSRDGGAQYEVRAGRHATNSGSANGRAGIVANANSLGWDAGQRVVHGWQPNAQGGGWWATEPDVGRVAHGVPARVDRLRGLGNAVVPQQAELVGRAIVDHAARHL